MTPLDSIRDTLGLAKFREGLLASVAYAVADQGQKVRPVYASATPVSAVVERSGGERPCFVAGPQHDQRGA